MSEKSTPFRNSLYEAMAVFEPKARCGTYTGALRLLDRLAEDKTILRGSMMRAYNRMEKAWQDSRDHTGATARKLGSGISKANWLLKRKHQKAKTHDGQKEVRLEFALADQAEQCETENAKHCGNAVAASSGLFGSKRGLQQIDLIRLADGEAADVIELKYVRPSYQGRGAAVVVGAAFQVAVYGLLLIFWHDRCKAFGNQWSEFVEKRPLFRKRRWSLRTLANDLCFVPPQEKGDAHRFTAARLRLLSDALAQDLNNVAQQNPSCVLGGPLEFGHSFHTYHEDLAEVGGVTPSTLNELMAARVDA